MIDKYAMTPQSRTIHLMESEQQGIGPKSSSISFLSLFLPYLVVYNAASHPEATKRSRLAMPGFSSFDKPLDRAPSTIRPSLDFNSYSSASPNSAIPALEFR